MSCWGFGDGACIFAKIKRTASFFSLTTVQSLFSIATFTEIF
jgi:hypothetical protein